GLRRGDRPEVRRREDQGAAREARRTRRARGAIVKRVLLLALLAACRGQPSTEQPIHLVPDMDWQPKFKAEQASPLWHDGRAMRPAVDGTVAQGQLRADERLYTGKVGDLFVAKSPVAVDEATIRRGRQRFNIYCTPCHDRTGSGQGMVVKRGYPPPVNLTSDRVLNMPDGQIFWTMTNGVRNMPSYRKQVPVEDRWA